ncbi:hypothetical protein BJV82DRAFT_708669 [Fennellomyces sp. T-0311]|nr:hypothetical protein BJV82DRAFT_708669 [Fennellomyces sp. T-0311]
MEPGDAYSARTKSTLDFTAIQEVFEKLDESFPELPAGPAAARYIQSLKALLKSDYTTMLGDAYSIIKLHRAASKEMQGDYDGAAQDAKATYLNFTSPCPDSYLAHGSALALKGDLYSARKVYETGIERVPQPELLHEPLTTVIHRIRKTKGYLNILPSSSIAQTLIHLSIKDLIELAMTCKYWYDIVFSENPSTFRSLSNKVPVTIAKIRPEQVRDISLEFVEPLIRKQIRTGSASTAERSSTNKNLSRTWDHDLMKDIIHTRRSQYKWIESISLKYFPEQLTELITSLRLKNLKRLMLYISPIHFLRKPKLLDAAWTFGNLQVIKCEMTMEETAIDRSSSQFFEYLESYTVVEGFHLTSLWISANLYPSALMGICQDIPALASLTLNSKFYKDPYVLNTVIQVCKNLKEFKYMEIDDTVPMTIRTTYTRSPPFLDVPEHVGLRTLVFRPDLNFGETFGDDININPFLLCILECSLETLESLDLSLDLFENGDYNGLELADGYDFLKLRTLTLRASETCEFNPIGIWAFLMKCPSLETVNVPPQWHEAIFHALPTKTVRRLSLSYDMTTKPRRKGDLPDVMEEFFSEARHLTELSVSATTKIELRSKAIFLLCNALRYSSVRSLDLHTTKMTKWQTIVGTMDLLTFTRIETLKIYIQKCKLAQQELVSFTEIPNLKHLVVYNDDRCFGPHQICMLLDLWEQPQMLIVRVIREKRKLVISGYKASIATTRQSDDLNKSAISRYRITTQNQLDRDDSNEDAW